MSVRFAIAASLGVLLIAALLVLHAPGVLRDYEHRRDSYEAVAMRVVEAKCTNFYFLISMCSVKLQGPSDANEHVTSIDQVFLGSMNGQRVFGVATHADPQSLTTNLGIQYLANRVLALSFLALLGALGMWGLLRKAMS
jgi:hypothetical protein